jgi:hypothetical protein
MKKPKNILSNDSPSFREGQLKGKSSQSGFHFTTPLLTRETEE